MDKQRNQIKASIASRNATTKLNSSNEKECVLFSVYTYENFPAIIDDTLGKQSSYNSFIREKADLAIFILDGVIGDKTKTEFEVAYNSLTESPRKAPGIIVFSKKIPHQDPGIAHIQQFLTENNQYYIEYENDAQLPAILDDNLNKFIQDQRAKELGRRRRLMKLAGRIALALLLVILLIVSGLGIAKCSRQNREKAREEALLSAQRLLDDYRKNGDDYDDESLFLTSLKELEKNGVKEGVEVRQLNKAVVDICKKREEAQKKTAAQIQINEVLVYANAWLHIPDFSTTENLLVQLREAVKLAEEYSLSTKELDDVVSKVNEAGKNNSQSKANNGGDGLAPNSVSAKDFYSAAQERSFDIETQQKEREERARAKEQERKVQIEKQQKEESLREAHQMYSKLESYEEKWIAGDISLQEYKAQINAVLPALQKAGMTEQVIALKDFLAKH